jgi:hypothetical protein
MEFGKQSLKMGGEMNFWEGIRWIAILFLFYFGLKEIVKEAVEESIGHKLDSILDEIKVRKSQRDIRTKLKLVWC